MKYICITEIDFATKILCTIEPQRTGPSMPKIKGFIHQWKDKSTWPVELASNGTYLRAPKYYGICDDDANTDVSGVLQVLSEEEYNNLKNIEHQARKPFPSWIGNINTMSWNPPVELPSDSIMNGGNVIYEWNEDQQSWIATP